MPIPTTHLHLCSLLLEEISDIDAYTFCLGSIAPDCLDPSDHRAFRNAHHIDDSGRFDSLGFYRKQLCRKQEQDIAPRSYRLGYFSHLWFDEFAKHPDEQIFIEQPGKKPANRQLLHSEIMHLDRTAVLNMGASIEAPSRPLELPVINGIDPNKTAEKYRTTVARLRRMQVGTPPAGFVSASAYADFLVSAKRGFRRCLEAL